MWNLLKCQSQTLTKGRFLMMALLTTISLYASTARGAQSVSLGWDASASAAGYVIYYGTNSGNYTVRMDVGTNINAAVAQLTESSTYYFAVSSYDSTMVESLPSSEISYVVPGLMRLTSGGSSGIAATLSFVVIPNHTYEIQASVDLVTWATLALTVMQTTNGWVQYQDPAPVGMYPTRFYRYIQH
jgi:hypothetical protein